MLTFLSPLFLIGLLAAAIPLVIHLTRSRRTKKIRFSTTRFFTAQFLRSYRMSRLKELLLLACRMAIFALLAMALARPLVLAGGDHVRTTQARSVVLVIDDSASMGYRENGVTLLDRARDTARNILAELHTGDTAAIVLAGRRATGTEVVFAEPTPALADVGQALDSIASQALPGDLTAAILQAERIQRLATAPSKEIYVLSDLQNSGWTRLEDESGADPSVSIYVVRIQPQERRNTAVTAVQFEAVRPLTGVPFTIRPHVHLRGDQAPELVIRLNMDGRFVAERRATGTHADSWIVPRFHHTFTTPGWHWGYVDTGEDPLLADNRRYFALEVLSSIKLLAVDGAPSNVPRLDELFFFKTALAAATEGDQAVQVETTTPDLLTTKELEPYPLVVLANVATLPEQVVDRLETFVDRGGSLLVFLGDRVVPDFYNRLLAGPTRLHGGLLPARLLEREGDPAHDKKPIGLGAVDFNHSVLSSFQDAKLGSLAGVRFSALWKTAPVVSGLLMQADTGTPILVEKNYGKGRVMLFTSTCNRDWTNFPVRPAYVPWLYRLVGYLAQEHTSGQNFYLTGERVRLSAATGSAGQEVLIRKPDGNFGYATPSGDPETPLEFSETTHPGVYAVMSADGKTVVQLFAANLDNAESDLTYLNDAELEQVDPASAAEVAAALKELLPGRPGVSYIEDSTRTNEVVLHAGRLELWDVLLWSVLAIALLEPWIANRLNVRHYLTGEARR